MKMRIPGLPLLGKVARPKAVTDVVRAAQVCRPYGWNGFSHSGRPQGSPLRRFSAAIQNGASRRPRPTKGESLQSGRVRTPAPTADAEASCPFVGAGHWPARRSRTSKHLLGKARRRCRTTPAAIFATPGPSGPGGIAEVTQILRAGNSPETVKYASPVMGSGESGPMGTKGPSAAPRGRFGYFAAMGKVTRRPQAAKLPCERNKGGGDAKRRGRGKIPPET